MDVFYQRSILLDMELKTFYCSSCWNKLPIDIKSDDTIKTFKKQLSAEMTSEFIINIL